MEALLNRLLEDDLSLKEEFELDSSLSDVLLSDVSLSDRVSFNEQLMDELLSDIDSESDGSLLEWACLPLA
jgi:hypothetical protein